MHSFTSVFLIGTSCFLMREVSSANGIAGICIIMNGSFVLNISAGHEYLLDPVRLMAENRGSWYMLIVAFLFSASINYDMTAMLNPDPVLGMVFTLLIISGVFVVLVTISKKNAGPHLLRHDEQVLTFGHLPETLLSLCSYYWPAVLTGIYVSAVGVAINIAFTLQIAPFVTAIKRFSIIFVVRYGTLLCAENEMRTLVLGSVLMVGGAVIILLFA